MIFQGQIFQKVFRSIPMVSKRTGKHLLRSQKNRDPPLWSQKGQENIPIA